jgi:large subunit ribosomal protein L31
VTHHAETQLVEAVCASCGSAYTFRSTATSLSIDICSNCHPAYTGVQAAGVAGSRIDRFNRRRALATT